MKTLKAILLSFLLVSTAAAQAAEFDNYETVPWDQVEWKILSLSPKRVVAIGDVHGDFDALVSILVDRGLVNAQGHWSGGSTHLVMMGDVVNGAGDSRLIIDLLMQLEKNRMKAVAEFIRFSGNHEADVIRGNSRMAKADRKLFEKHPVDGKDFDDVRKVFQGDTVYAKWLRSKNAIVKIGNKIYSHAGLHRWADKNDPGRINATVRAWISHWQGKGAEPPRGTRWAVGLETSALGFPDEAGPLWMRGMKPVWDKQEGKYLAEKNSGAPKKERLQEALKV